MPAQSAQQQQAAGIALAAKRGEKRVKDLSGSAKSMYESMSERQLEEMASGTPKDKPKHDRSKTKSN